MPDRQYRPVGITDPLLSLRVWRERRGSKDMATATATAAELPQLRTPGYDEGIVRKIAALRAVLAERCPLQQDPL